VKSINSVSSLDLSYVLGKHSTKHYVYALAPKSLAQRFYISSCSKLETILDTWFSAKE
jgi:hypothetical protein